MADALSSVFPKSNARLVVMMLEVLAFPLDTNDVVNSLERMERKIKEFERYANIQIPELLNIGIVIRHAEKGPMRTHLIMNSHKLATFQENKTEVTNVKQVMARTGDEMDVDAFTKKDRPKVLPKALARARTQKWCVGTAGRKVIELPLVAKNKGTTTKATAKGKATRKCSKASASSAARCRKLAGPKKRVRSKRAKKAWR